MNSSNKSRRYLSDVKEWGEAGVNRRRSPAERCINTERESFRGDITPLLAGVAAHGLAFGAYSFVRVWAAGRWAGLLSDSAAYPVSGCLSSLTESFPLAGEVVFGPARCSQLPEMPEEQKGGESKKYYVPPSCAQQASRVAESLDVQL